MKQEATRSVVSAIRQVLAGRVYLSAEMQQRLDHKLGGRQRQNEEILSNRELEVFGLIGQGYKPREIAQQLNLSVKTVETHREHIKRKLSLENAAELTRAAIEWTRDHA